MFLDKMRENKIRAMLGKGERAFAGCSSLSLVELKTKTEGNGIKVGNSAFKDCTAVSTLRILPAYIRSVGKGVFAGWTKDQTVSIRGYHEKTFLKKEGKAWDKKWNAGCSASVPESLAGESADGQYAFDFLDLCD